MKRMLAIVAAVALLSTPLVLGAETPTPPEKAPAPPRTPETGIDPRIQVDPGPSPDPRSAVPPKINPDPGMAINPDAVPRVGPKPDGGAPRREPGPEKPSDPGTKRQ